MTQIEVFGSGRDKPGNSAGSMSAFPMRMGMATERVVELTVSAVKGLLYDLPIQGYCAINLDGLPVLTESVGGVTVTVPNDSLEEKYPEFKKGAQVTLNGENTETSSGIGYHGEPERAEPHGAPAGSISGRSARRQNRHSLEIRGL